MKVDLVFQGGGARGIAYVGATRALQNQRTLEIRRLVGTFGSRLYIRRDGNCPQ